MSEETSSRISLNLTESRKRRLNRVKELTGESTNTKAIDKAVHHLEQSAREVEDLAEEPEEEFQAEADRYAPGKFELEVSVEASGIDGE